MCRQPEPYPAPPFPDLPRVPKELTWGSDRYTRHSARGGFQEEEEVERASEWSARKGRSHRQQRKKQAQRCVTTPLPPTPCPLERDSQLQPVAQPQALRPSLAANSNQALQLGKQVGTFRSRPGAGQPFSARLTVQGLPRSLPQLQPPPRPRGKTPCMLW